MGTTPATTAAHRRPAGDADTCVAELRWPVTFAELASATDLVVEEATPDVGAIYRSPSCHEHPDHRSHANSRHTVAADLYPTVVDECCLRLTALHTADGSHSKLLAAQRLADVLDPLTVLAAGPPPGDAFDVPTARSVFEAAQLWHRCNSPGAQLILPAKVHAELRAGYSTAVEPTMERLRGAAYRRAVVAHTLTAVEKVDLACSVAVAMMELPVTTAAVEQAARWIVDRLAETVISPDSLHDRAARTVASACRDASASSLADVQERVVDRVTTTIADRLDDLAEADLAATPQLVETDQSWLAVGRRQVPERDLLDLLAQTSSCVPAADGWLSTLTPRTADLLSSNDHGHLAGPAPDGWLDLNVRDRDELARVAANLTGTSAHGPGLQLGLRLAAASLDLPLA